MSELLMLEMIGADSQRVRINNITKEKLLSRKNQRRT